MGSAQDDEKECAHSYDKREDAEVVPDVIFESAEGLQRSKLTLSGARRLFDLVCQRYPQLKPRLAPTADIFNYSSFNGKEPLTAVERVACADFRRADRGWAKAVPSAQSTSELSLAQQAFKKRKTSKRSLYDDVAFIPPTSNECERFFSSAKLVYSDLRKRLDPSTLEMRVFLMYSKDMRDVYTVESVRS
ncbi:Ribonuclease H-like domain [Phytophthora cactorum]|nr:Ribonuclease H-like domain [Phytophthora cactorum]